MKPRTRQFMKRAVIGLGIVLILTAAAFAHPRVRFLGWYATRMARARLGLIKIDLATARARLLAQLPAGTVLPLPAARINIDKSDRKLDLLDANRIMKSYPVAFGPEPVGTKLHKGDGRTPEGNYNICRRREGTKDWLFLGINYPNADDARRGMEAGLLDKAHFEEFARAERDHATPPWKTAMGGAIGIHGGGIDNRTAGCIALSDSDIEEVFVATADWTPVEIRP